VIAPCLIALLMVIGGTIVTQFEAEAGPRWPARNAVFLNWVGIVLALYVFMEHSIRVLPQGTVVTRTVLPTRFNWPLFAIALLLMAVALGELLWQVWTERRGRVTTPALD
jgi:hypothetical protein